MAISVEKPVDGVLKLATSVLYGEEKDDSESTQATSNAAKNYDGEDNVWQPMWSHDFC